MRGYRDTIERFNGFGDDYDRYRPTPPEVIKEILINYLDKEPETVVDLGCGTGLSTFIWKESAKQIIGIDPNKDMLDTAMRNKDSYTGSNHILFKMGYSNETNIDSGYADIITCASAFQWMEPESTVHEALRILKDGGIFAIYNHDGIPAVDWEIEKAYKKMFLKFYTALDELRGRETPWTIEKYLEFLKESGKFNFIKEVVLHSKVTMTAEDIIGFAFSQGALHEIRKHNISWAEEEIEKFIKLVHSRIGDNTKEAIFSYRMRISRKQ